MNSRPTEHRYPASHRDGLEHIDLTRRLPSLKSSLTPENGSPAARLRTHPIPIPEHRPGMFLPVLITVLLVLAAIAGFVIALLPPTP